MNQLEKLKKGDLLKVIVVPNSSKTAITGINEDESLKITISAPPEKDKANEELLKYLKKNHKLRAKIVKGSKTRKKTLEII